MDCGYFMGRPNHNIKAHTKTQHLVTAAVTVRRFMVTKPYFKGQPLQSSLGRGFIFNSIIDFLGLWKLLL